MKPPRVKWRPELTAWQQQTYDLSSQPPSVLTQLLDGGRMTAKALQAKTSVLRPPSQTTPMKLLLIRVGVSLRRRGIPVQACAWG